MNTNAVRLNRLFFVLPRIKKNIHIAAKIQQTFLSNLKFFFVISIVYTAQSLRDRSRKQVGSSSACSLSTREAGFEPSYRV